jgi:hypothetical protein
MERDEQTKVRHTQEGIHGMTTLNIKWNNFLKSKTVFG